MQSAMGPNLVDDQDGFRFTNLIDLVFPRWKDAVAHVTPKDYESMGKAMRYYRVWVYISCIVTVIPAIIFAGVVAWIFSADYFRLLPLPPYDWTFIYLYAAVFFQIFVGPALGCVGACRLNQRFLWAYWGSMVALCLMDAVIGVVWAMKLTQLNIQLFEHLKSLLPTFGSDSQFSLLWDQLQREEECCGVHNASDYLTTAWFAETNKLQQGPKLDGHFPKDFFLPSSCCSFQSTEGLLATENCTVLGGNWGNVHKTGCYLALHTWMHSMGDILFVIGYAIIGFIRGSLVFCLYSEIKHFIRKIYIRGVPREMHHASVSVGSDLINYHRHNTVTNIGNNGKKLGSLTSSTAVAIPRGGDGSLRRWSFMRHWKGWSGIASRQEDETDDATIRPSTSTVKLKSINEENTTML